MDAIISLVSFRFKRFFDFKHSGLQSISRVISLFAFSFSGYLFAAISNQIAFQKELITLNEFNKYVYLLITLIVFTKGLFPSFTPIKHIIQSNLPVTAKKKFLLQIINEFVDIVYLGIFCFILIYTLIINLDGLVFITNSLLLVIMGHLSKRLFIYSIQKNIKISFRISFLLIVILLPFLFYSFFLSDNLSIYFCLFIIFFLFVINYYVDNNFRIEKIGVRNYSNKKVFRWFINIFQNNQQLRTVLIISLIVKVLMVFINGWKSFKGIPLLPIQLYGIILFLSPLILFTYIFNNLFGYLRSLWLTHTLIGSSFTKIVKSYTSILILPLFLDFLISLILLYSLNLLNYSTVLVWFNITIFMIPFGIYSSFIFPQKINNIISIKSNTNVVSIIVSLVVSVSIILLTFYNPILATISTIAVSTSLFYLGNKIIKNKDFKVYSKLF